MRTLPIPPGAKIALGQPPLPMAFELSGRFAKAIAMVPGLAEAHLPQCFIAGVMEKPEQVLVVVCVPGGDVEEIVAAIKTNLSTVLPADQPLGILSLDHDSELVEPVRRSQCGILWTNEAAPLQPPAWALPFGIPEGAQVTFKRPVRPLPGFLIRCMASLIASLPGVVEGHLPECFVQEVMKRPAQVLVLVVAADANEREVVAAVEKGLETFMRPDQRIEIWPMPTTSTLLAAVREVCCGVTRSTW